jgi:nucleoside-diphosphate-sugar epimerase
MGAVVGKRRYLVTGGSGFIGDHMMRCLGESPDTEVVNFDMNPPTRSSGDDWHEGDVLDQHALSSLVRDFGPTHVVHLAARVDIEGETLDDYRVNTEGCSNLVAAIRNVASVQRTVFTSTQFVCRPGYEPRHDRDYSPHTLYGESKAMSEEYVRGAELDSEWSIVRPTTVWGPGDLFYREQFYRVLDRGLYMHPGRKPCLRSYGYVGNVTSQIQRLAEAPAEVADGATFYVGDDLVDVIDFVNAFSRQLKGREVRVVPAGFVRGLGLVGDGLAHVGVTFPITSGRYRSMIEDYPVPIRRTIDALGTDPYSLEDGVEATLADLRATGFLSGEPNRGN